MKKKNIFLGLVILAIVIISVILWLVFRMKVSKQEALDISYNYVGITKDDVSYVKIEKDFFDNKYEIKFNDGNYNYEIEVHGKSGEIIDFEKKAISNINHDHTNKDQNNINQYLTKEEVKTIVINHSNVDINDIVFTKIDMEVEHGTMVYEIEFIYNNLEYEYEIDAKTGEVLKHKIDR